MRAAATRGALHECRMSVPHARTRLLNLYSCIGFSNRPHHHADGLGRSRAGTVTAGDAIPRRARKAGVDTFERRVASTTAATIPTAATTINDSETPATATTTTDDDHERARASGTRAGCLCRRVAACVDDILDRATTGHHPPTDATW